MSGRRTISWLCMKDYSIRAENITMMDIASREGSTDGSLSDKSSLSGVDKAVTEKMVAAEKLGMPSVDRRESKPASEKNFVDPAVQFAEGTWTVPFPKSLGRWVDVRDCTVVTFDCNRFRYAAYIADVKAVPEGPEMFHMREDGRCMDL